MLPLGLFARRNFAVGNVQTFAMYGGLGITFFLLVLFLQEVAGYRALQAGVALMPSTIVMFLLSKRMRRLADRFGPRLFMGLGPLTAAVGLALMLRVDGHLNYFTDLLPALLVFSIGLACTVAPLTAAVLSDAEESNAGIASGCQPLTLCSRVLSRESDSRLVQAGAIPVAREAAHEHDRACSTSASTPTEASTSGPESTSLLVAHCDDVLPTAVRDAWSHKALAPTERRLPAVARALCRLCEPSANCPGSQSDRRNASGCAVAFVAYASPPRRGRPSAGACSRAHLGRSASAWSTAASAAKGL
jgi:hypothetical protein